MLRQCFQVGTSHNTINSWMVLMLHIRVGLPFSLKQAIQWADDRNACLSKDDYRIWGGPQRPASVQRFPIFAM